MANELKGTKENSIWLAITHHIKKQEITQTANRFDVSFLINYIQIKS